MDNIILPIILIYFVCNYKRLVIMIQLVELLLDVVQAELNYVIGVICWHHRDDLSHNGTLLRQLKKAKNDDVTIT